MRYLKKPIIIEAIRYNGENASGIIDWAGNEIIQELRSRNIGHYKQEDGLLIKTLEGLMRADKGDWIIKGIKGEFYPCKPDIFEKTYDSVEDSGGTEEIK